MRGKFGVVLMAVGLCAGARASEPVCYTTAEAAAAQTGIRGVDGFRLEGRARDVFSGAVWARIKSCAHPERPAFLVLTGGIVGRPGTVSRSEAASLVLVAGSRVTLIQKDELVRIEMQGVAQGSGSVGDRVKVRLLTLSEDGGEQYAEGIIRGKDVVEMVTR